MAIFGDVATVKNGQNCFWSPMEILATASESQDMSTLETNSRTISKVCHSKNVQLYPIGKKTLDILAVGTDFWLAFRHGH